MDRVLEYEIPSEYDGANITTVLKQHFKISTNLIKDLKKYKEGILRVFFRRNSRIKPLP